MEEVRRIVMIDGHAGKKNCGGRKWEASKK